jgi:hypothetical protein
MSEESTRTAGQGWPLRVSRRPPRKTTVVSSRAGDQDWIAVGLFGSDPTELMFICDEIGTARRAAGRYA